jgi:hypothetical protein
MSRPGLLVWGEGAEQLNKYLKDLREGNWTPRPPRKFSLKLPEGRQLAVLSPGRDAEKSEVSKTLQNFVLHSVSYTTNEGPARIQYKCLVPFLHSQK